MLGYVDLDSDRQTAEFKYGRNVCRSVIFVQPKSIPFDVLIRCSLFSFVCGSWGEVLIQSTYLFKGSGRTVGTIASYVHQEIAS